MRILALILVFALLAGCTQKTEQGSYYQAAGGSQQTGGTPDLDAGIVGCNTNFGISGETTTVYVTIANSGTGPAEDVQVAFSASDNDGKPLTLPLGFLPQGRKVTISGAVDTKFRVATTAQIIASAKGFSPITRYSADCRELDKATKQNLDYLVQLGRIAIP